MVASGWSRPPRALRGLAGDLKERLAKIPGITDLQIEKQVLIPQYKIHLDYDAAARYGVASGDLLQRLEQLLAGERIGQVIEGNRRFDLTLRLPEDARSERGLENLLIETPGGRVPLSLLARIEDGEGPNQIGRENTRRRIVISANTDGSDMSRIIADIRGGSHSMNELDVLDLCRGRGLPEPRRQSLRVGVDGKRYIDAEWPEYGVTLEVQGAGHGELLRALDDDVRLVELSTEGSCAVSISVLTLRANPDAFFRAFAELLASRGWLRPAS